MKKLLNVLLVAILLLVGMTPVFAASGKITIANAEAGKTYKIYEILHLESYNEEKNAFAYKATTKWKSFVESETGKKYFNTNEQGYVTWVTNADVATFAKFPASKQQTIKTLLPVSAVATANPVRTPSQNKISFGSLAASLQHSK